MKKAVTTSLVLAGLAGLLSCSESDKKISASDYFPLTREDSLALERMKPMVADTYALDGSRVVAQYHSDGSFTFYRDKDHDGWADTYGRGFFWFGANKISEEDIVKAETFGMDALVNDYGAPTSKKGPVGW